MTYKFYKRFQTAFFLLFIAVILLNQVGDKISWLMQHQFLANATLYAIPVLSLSLLYFGIYSRMCKIKTAQKINGPVALIVLGSFFTLLSFGRPILGFLLIHNTRVEFFTAAKLQTIRETALDVREQIEERLASAKYYFIYSGDSIEYFDENGNRTLFTPSNSDKKEREDSVQRRQNIEKMVLRSQRIVINLITLGVVSCLGFLMLLKHKFCHS